MDRPPPDTVSEQSQASAEAGSSVSRFVCPFCGAAAATETACGACGARTDPLSRQATQNEMGPWFVRDEAHPHRPGCRLETIERWARVGKITPETVIRGPSTAQNWAPARRVPGVARLFGFCHGCGSEVHADEISCRACGAHLHAERDRQHLGLSPVRDLPGRGDPGAHADRLLLNEPKFAALREATPHVAAREEATRRQPASGERVGSVEDGAGSRADPGGYPGVSRSSREGVLERRLAAAKRQRSIAVGVAVVVAVIGAGLVAAGLVGDEFGAAAADGGEANASAVPADAESGGIEGSGDEPVGADSSEVAGEAGVGRDVIGEAGETGETGEAGGAGGIDADGTSGPDADSSD